VYKIMKNILKNVISKITELSSLRMRGSMSWIPDRVGNDRDAAFTLVETLVAISILMMSVTGPLYYASESLKAAVYARDQITAFYLAQDAFEQVRKIRDDNYYGNAALWEQSLTECLSNYCTIANYMIISTPADYDLYMSNDGIYSHQTSGTKTIFSRGVMIEPTDGDGGVGDWTNSTEMKVTVKIMWNSRGVAREFEAYEFLRNFN